MITHPATGFAIGDPSVNPLDTVPDELSARLFFESLVLSASGWRGVFGRADDDMSETISPAAAYSAAKMAAVFADYILAAHEAPALALGIDSRPTGPAIADVMARVFIAKGIKLSCAFICAAPEIMAWTRRSAALSPTDANHLDAFCYISASHNPAGHNGVKFGLGDGGVLAAAHANKLIAELKKGAASKADIAAMRVLVSAADTKRLSSVYSSVHTAKRRSLSDYMLFTREVAGMSSDLAAQEAELDALGAALSIRGAGIIAELNGSARALSIDEDFLSGLGVSVIKLNAEPRRFVHRIVPEGASLDMCRRALDSAHTSDPAFTLGYVPDCDGDRGNMVYFNAKKGRAEALEAQDTFALAVLAELSVLSAAALRTGRTQKLALACNDATSLRIDALCSFLGARVFRSETGEANVVSLARELRAQGYTVRILGEGSNGGVITHPACVRDPLNTLSALLKLLYLRDDNGTPGPFKLWLERSGQSALYRDDFDMTDVLASIPAYTTTSVFEENAALKVRATDHAKLKNAYETVFKKNERELIARLSERYGPVTWVALASNSSSEKPAAGFASSGRGGLKLQFIRGSGEPAAFLWMRGSGTEPVFRVMADVSGSDKALETWLLQKHSAMVQEADAMLV